MLQEWICQRLIDRQTISDQALFHEKFY